MDDSMAVRLAAMKDHLSKLDDRIARLGQIVPPASPPPSPPRRRDWKSPVSTIRSTLFLFIVSACFLIVGDLFAIFLQPNSSVVVAALGDGFQVWSDVQSFESEAGESWIKLPPGTVDISATYHGSQRDLAWSSIVMHVLFLVMTVGAYRAARRIRSEEGGQHGGDTGVMT